MVIVYNLKNYTIYVGVDKFENEELINFFSKFMQQTGLTMIWFHSDTYSSPHAYIRMNEGETKPPADVVAVCCQIVKDGSIKGTKDQAMDVVYTYPTNLEKTKAMNPGQCRFLDMKDVWYVRAVRKNAQILKKLPTVRSDCSIKDLEDELEDLLAISKKKPAKKNTKSKGEEPPPSQQSKTNDVHSMLEGMSQAEFSTNLEDDFM